MLTAVNHQPVYLINLVSTVREKQHKRLDEIGKWSQDKLDIIKKYTAAYSSILSSKGHSFYHVYIDAFAGAGIHISKDTGETVQGSPITTLCLDTPFREYYFVDLNAWKIDVLKNLVGEKSNVNFYVGDCNEILLKEIFSQIRYNEFKRAFCLLDPYAMDLKWQVVEAAAKQKTIEVLLNFPVLAMNRNVLRHDRSTVTPANIKKMNDFWGDESWGEIAYTKERSLFGWEEKTESETLVEGYKKRLKEVAGFKFVSKHLPMKNSTGGVVYYLVFASHNRTGNKIINDIFNKYR